jgi:hypothetical protein
MFQTDRRHCNRWTTSLHYNKSILRSQNSQYLTKQKSCLLCVYYRQPSVRYLNCPLLYKHAYKASGTASRCQLVLRKNITSGVNKVSSFWLLQSAPKFHSSLQCSIWPSQNQCASFRIAVHKHAPKRQRRTEELDLVTNRKKQP